MSRVLLTFTCLLAVSSGLPQRDIAGCPTSTTTASPSPSSPERQCGCTAAKLWLDIILVVDNSASMGKIGLNNIKATLVSVFGKLTVGQDLVQKTRVALISYDSKPKLIANLTAYTDNHDLLNGLYTITPTDNVQVNVLDALKMHEVVVAGVTAIETRQTVIVLVASAYDGQGSTDPAPYAKQIRESGVTLLTIAFVRNNEGVGEVQKLANLASPGYSFDTKKDQSTLADRIQDAFCRANCFCPNGWVQVADDFQKPTANYAECVRLSSSPSNWFGASMGCANDVNNNAFLASELSDAKHKFHADYVRNVNKGKVQPYFIGLSWDDASQQYLWSEKFPNGTQIPLDPSVYQTWASGSGNHGQDPDGVQVVPLGFDAYWYDVDQYSKNGAYICQVNACDTDNYCDDSVDDDQ